MINFTAYSKFQATVPDLILSKAKANLISMIYLFFPGSLVGPTFTCIIGRQFEIPRVGDRFWHERQDPNIGFTPGDCPIVLI